MSYEEQVVDDDEDDRDQIAPLHVNSSAHYSRSKKPEYAQSVQSSNFGHTTYFDQMDQDQEMQNKYDIKPSCFNRIHSYIALFEILMQFFLEFIIINTYFEKQYYCSTTYTITESNGECMGDLTSCRNDKSCYTSSNESSNAGLCDCFPLINPYLTLLIIYSVIILLIIFYLIYKNCLVCYALGEGKRNKKLFINGHVIHYIWMDRIADTSSIICCCFMCRNNMATIAYYKAIDQYEAFPTKISFIISNIIRILNILFIGLYIYLYIDHQNIGFNSVGIVVIMGLVHITTFIVGLSRIKTKKTIQNKRRIQKSPSQIQ